MPQQTQPVDDWQDVTDDWQTVTEPVAKPVVSNLAQEKPSWFDTAASYIPLPVKKGWEWATKPLTDYITDSSGNKILDPQAAANFYDNPATRTEDQWEIPDWIPYVGGGKLRALGAGMLEGAGNVVTGLSSPLNLATMGTGTIAAKTATAAPNIARAAGMATRALSAPVAAHGAATIANPDLSPSERAFGIAELAGGAAGLKTPIPKGAGALENLPVKQPTPPIEPAAVTPESMPVRPPVSKVETPPEQPIAKPAGVMPGEFDPSTLQGLKRTEPKPEIEFVDPNTGEVRPASQAKPGDVPIIPDETTPTAPTRSLSGIGEVSSAAGKEIMSQVESVPSTPILPRNLAGAKPRFYFGQGRGYNPIFESDLDKALYIIAQTRKSRGDAGYLKFVMDHTGLDETGARALGQEVKAYIKAQAQSKEPGDIQISKIIKTGEADGDGKPPSKPPTITGGEGEIPPEPAKPTSEVTQSLANRLQKVVDDAGKPNPAAPEEISKLLDEATKVSEYEPGIVRQVLGANKALLTSWDLSAPGRQGKSFIFNKAWWTSLDDMIKAWGSKEAAEQINQSIFDHPSGYFKKGATETGKEIPSFAEKVGLDLTPTEEMFRTTFGRAFEKYSLVGKSSRAHTAFLNKLRSDQFVSMMDAAKKAGLNPETDIRIPTAYAKFINEATGRGSVNIGKWKLERNIGMLNDVFFAPKNMSGQIRTWNNVLNPIKYMNYDPVLRKQALTSLFAIAGLGLGVGEMARLVGASVSNDPTSSDFRKIKIGKDTRIDLFGGYQQFPVAAMKLLSGQQTSTITGRTTDLTTGKFGQTTRQSVAERFFTNRLSPLGSFIWAWMSNREFDSKPFEVKRALYERVFPIAAKDIYDMAKEDPMLAAILAVPVTMGIAGTQTYTGR